MKTLFTLLAFTFIQISAIAQHACGSSEYSRAMAQANPTAWASIQQAENNVNAILQAQKTGVLRDTTANELITIPVVIHVLYNNASQNISDAQIKSQLEALNNDFANLNADKSNRPGAFKNDAADMRIKFCLAQVDPQNARTTGIIRKYTTVSQFNADDAMKIASRGGSTAWNTKKYLNIWVCPMNVRTLGYATSPGSAVELDGVVIGFDVFGTTGTLRAPFNKGRTATHEVGHWMGLKHLWGDTDCGDDGIDDTPRQKSYNFGCPSFPRVTTCSETANGDMFMNFMDFTDDACMNMFTKGQKQKMRAFFAQNGARNGFLTAFGCDSNLVQGSTIPTVVPAVDTPAVVTPKNVVKIYPNPVINQLTVDSKNANATTPQTVKIFDVTGNCVFTSVLTQTTTNLSVSQLKAGIYIIRVIDGKEATANKFIKK
jgi:Secretion system C-terminal sorting domain/Pregnancy-associated plasma protein-A